MNTFKVIKYTYFDKTHNKWVHNSSNYMLELTAETMSLFSEANDIIFTYPLLKLKTFKKDSIIGFRCDKKFQLKFKSVEDCNNCFDCINGTTQPQTQAVFPESQLQFTQIPFTQTEERVYKKPRMYNVQSVADVTSSLLSQTVVPASYETKSLESARPKSAEENAVESTALVPIKLTNENNKDKSIEEAVVQMFEDDDIDAEVLKEYITALLKDSKFQEQMKVIEKVMFSSDSAKLL